MYRLMLSILLIVIPPSLCSAQIASRTWETLRPASQPDTDTLVIKNDTPDTTIWIGPLAPSYRKVHVYSKFDGDSVHYRLIMEVAFDKDFPITHDSTKKVLLTSNGADFSTVRLAYAMYYRFIVEPLAKQDVSDSSKGVIKTIMSD